MSRASRSERRAMGLRQIRSAATVFCFLAAAAAVSPAQAARPSGFRWSAPRRVDQVTAYVKPALLGGISCLSGGPCVGVGSFGSVETSTNPTSPGSWHGFSLNRRIYLESVSCPSAALCVAVSNLGDIYSTANPASGAGAWHKHSSVLDNPETDLGGIACPGSTLCVAVNGSEEIATSTNPGSATPTWHHVTITGGHQFAGVSCPSLSACVVLDFNGRCSRRRTPRAGRRHGFRRARHSTTTARSTRSRVAQRRPVLWPIRSVRWSLRLTSIIGKENWLRFSGAGIGTGAGGRRARGSGWFGRRGRPRSVPGGRYGRGALG